MSTLPAAARLEIKCVGRESELPELLHWLKLNGAGFRPAFPDRQVNSLYFDTDGYESWDSTLQAAPLRWKVRYRWYGASRVPAAGQLEIKQKRNIFGWKERYPIESLDGLEEGSWRGFRERLRIQLPVTGRRWLDSHPLPAVLNVYQRRYFATPDSRLRVTVDTRHESWDHRFGRGPSGGRRLALPRHLVVEFKFAREDRARAASAMQGIHLRPSAHSKYASALRAMDL